MLFTSNTVVPTYAKLSLRHPSSPALTHHNSTLENGSDTKRIPRDAAAHLDFDFELPRGIIGAWYTTTEASIVTAAATATTQVPRGASVRFEHRGNPRSTVRTRRDDGGASGPSTASLGFALGL